MADSDPDDRGVTSEALDASRVMNDLRFVADGEELLEYLERRGAYVDPVTSPRPGIILLDLDMPRLDGREALRAIKATPFLRQIPVVVLTTSTAEADICRAYELGASSVITRPVTWTGLVEMFRTLGKYWLETVDLPAQPSAVST